MIDSVTDFAFEEDGHTYVSKGRNHPSVTGLLKQYGLINYDMVKREVLERKRTQGKLLHEWTARYDATGESDLLSIAEDAEGYAESYMKFRRESGFEVLEIEKPIMSSIYGVTIGGTPDRRMRYKRTRDVTLDLKFCAQEMPAWKAQTAAYEMMKTRKTSLGRTERYSLMLFPDNRYNLRFYSDPSDGDAFLAIMALEAYKQNNGIKNERN